MSRNSGVKPDSYSHPLVCGKGTRKDSSIGPHCLSRSKKGGKGDMISGTFGDGWEKEIESRLEVRMLACTKCGVVRGSGICPDPCNYESKFGGW